MKWPKILSGICHFGTHTHTTKGWGVEWNEGQFEIVCLLIKHITYSNADWRLVSSIIGADTGEAHLPLDAPKLAVQAVRQTTHYQIVDPMSKDSITACMCLSMWLLVCVCVCGGVGGYIFNFIVAFVL